MKLSNSNRMAVVVVIVGAILVAVVSAFALNIPGLGKYESARVANGVVTIPVARVSDGKAHFYQFEDGGKKIAFVVVKASDGLYRTAFDACDSCFRAKKGYEQKGGVLVCLNCNRQFAIDRIAAHEVGGCNPSFLPSKATATGITITAADLKTGARYF